MSAELDYDGVLVTVINEVVSSQVPHALDGDFAHEAVLEMISVARRYGEFITHIATPERIDAFLQRDFDLKESRFDDLNVAGLVKFSGLKDSEKDELLLIQRTAGLVNADGIRKSYHANSFLRLSTSDAMEVANEQAGDMISDISDTDRKRINRIVSRGIHFERSREQIADDIFEYVKDDQMTEHRARLIADTEVSTAMHTGAEAAALDLGMNRKSWITRGDNVVTEGCRHNEGRGPIGINMAYPSGIYHPPRFPGCRCSQLYSYHEVKGKDAPDVGSIVTTSGFSALAYTAKARRRQRSAALSPKASLLALYMRKLASFGTARISVSSRSWVLRVLNRCPLRPRRAP